MHISCAKDWSLYPKFIRAKCSPHIAEKGAKNHSPVLQMGSHVSLKLKLEVRKDCLSQGARDMGTLRFQSGQFKGP